MLAVAQTYTAVANKRIKKLAMGIGGSMELAALTRRPGVASFNVYGHMIIMIDMLEDVCRCDISSFFVDICFVYSLLIPSLTH